MSTSSKYTKEQASILKKNLLIIKPKWNVKGVHSQVAIMKTINIVEENTKSITITNIDKPDELKHTKILKDEVLKV